MNDQNSQISSFTRFIFAFIAIGFTLISGWNGFFFYRILFGTTLATLLIFTFEISRLACIFRYMQSQRTGTLTLTLYIITATVCAFASINSFTSEVILRDQHNTKELNKSIHLVKNHYYKQTLNEEKSLKRDVNYLANKISQYPNSGYWKRRFEVAQNYLDKFSGKRTEYMQENPEEPREWIETQSAILGLQIENSSKESEEIRSATMALEELWGLEKKSAQKIMSIVLTITVELAILLLVFLSAGQKKTIPKPIPELIPRETKNQLNETFGKEQVDLFFQKIIGHYQATKKLPHMSKINKSIRPIKKAIEELTNQKMISILKKSDPC